MKRLISKIDFAEMVNVSPAAITKACNNKLKPSFDGKRIDINHSCVIEYIKRKESQQLKKSSDDLNQKKLKKVNSDDDFNKTDDNFQDENVEEYHFVKVDKKKSVVNPKQSNAQIYTDTGREIPKHIRKYLKYTVEDVINEFGTEVALNDFLLSIKRIEDIETARIKNDKSKGILVERELIEKGILNPMDSAFTKLLTDGSKTITKRLLAKKESGAELHELEEFTSSQISSFLKALKQSIKRTLEQLENNVVKQ